MTKIPVTVAVPIKNEAVNLPRCLAALSAYDEIIVIDSSSTDASGDIVRDHGAKLVNFEWNGSYPKKRNWFLDTVPVRNDWVLFLDADEVVNPAFDQALGKAISDTDRVGFWITYDNFFMGRKLRFGVPQRKLALFRKDAGRFERIDEDRWSKLDMEVHEHPVLNGSVGQIEGKVEHRDFQGIQKFLLRHVDYANWESQRYRSAIQKMQVNPKSFTFRQKMKYRNLTQFWFAWVYFIYSYLFRLGFLDGSAGFYYAYFKSWYFTTIRLLIVAENRLELDRK